MNAHALIAQVLDGDSPFKVVTEKVDPAAAKRMENLKSNDKVVVYHGTQKVYLPQMINGFDAAKQKVPSSYGGGPHVGLFVTLDFDTAERFSSYAECILELEVRAKNLHGTNWDGVPWGKKEDGLFRDKFPNSFRPGLSYSMTSGGSEPQAILLGMVGPNQIKRIRWATSLRKYKWFTRNELIKSGTVIVGEPGGGGRIEHKLTDFGINLSSTRTTVPELFKAIAAHLSRDERRDYPVERVERVFKAFATHGADGIYEKLRYTFYFGETAARVLADKVMSHFSKTTEAKDLISKVIDGEDPFDVVREMTKTSAIAKYPKPMGLVKKTRRKDQGDKPTYEDLLERAQAWLMERKKAPTMIMYHGTSTKFLREILKKGLVPSPRMRVWQDDESARQYASQETRRSLDSVYFTANFMTAVSAGGNAHRKFGGTYLFIAAQIQPRSAYADEDTIKIKFRDAMQKVFDYRFVEDPSAYWFEAVGMDHWKQWGFDVANRLATLLAKSKLPFGLGKKGEKIPPEVDGCVDAVRGFVEQAATIRYAQGGEKWLTGHLWRTKWPDTDWDAPDGKKQAAVERLKKEMPTAIKAENRYLKGMDKLTRHYKDLAMPGSDDETGIPNWFSHTLRIPETVNYSGRNKILSIFQTLKVGDINYVTVHYGNVTPSMIADMKRSSWLSGGETKTITAAEAKKLGITSGE